MSGRYYYCVVKATVDSSTATATSTPVLLKVQAANYSILDSGTTTYYNTLNSAVSDAKSGGGSSGGGTIKVLNDLTDNLEVSTDKTITIDTNGKTLTRNTSIITTGGTLTIAGSGTIYCNSSTSDTSTIYCKGGDLVTAGSSSSNKLLLKGYANTIRTTNDSENLTLTNTYIYDLRGTAVFLSGEATVYNNSTDGTCFYLGTSGITLNFNTIGNFRTRGNYVIYSGTNSATLNLTKGKFTSYNSNGYMFYINI